MSNIQLQVLQLAEGILKLGFGFPGEADNNICGDRNALNPPADTFNQAAVLCISLAAPHGSQDGIITSLGWHFNVRHNLGQPLHTIDQLIAQPVWVGS